MVEDDKKTSEAPPDATTSEQTALDIDDTAIGMPAFVLAQEHLGEAETEVEAEGSSVDTNPEIQASGLGAEGEATIIEGAGEETESED